MTVPFALGCALAAIAGLYLAYRQGGHYGATCEQERWIRAGERGMLMYTAAGTWRVTRVTEQTPLKELTLR